MICISRWWQLKYFWNFHPLLGEDSNFDQYFSDGLKPPTRYYLKSTPFLLQGIQCVRDDWTPEFHISESIAIAICKKGVLMLNSGSERKRFVFSTGHGFVGGSLNYPFRGDQTLQIYGHFGGCAL